MENHSDKMKIFLNASIQEITMLAEILAAEIIREKPKDPYKHLAMCLQTMIDIRETTDFREHMKNVATKKQATYRHYQPEYKRSLELLYEKAAMSANQETNRDQSDCKPTASELIQIKAATTIQRAYRRHRNFSHLENGSMILTQKQQTDRIIEEAYKQHCSLYEQDEISEEQDAIIIQEIEREDHDELDKKSKKHLMESAMSTTFTRNSVGLEEKVPSWFENLMSRRSSVPLSRQVSTIASDLKKGPSAWIDANSTLNILPSYTKHSPNENQTYKSRKHSCELPVSPRQYLKTKYDITPSNRTPKSPYSPNNSDDMLHLTRSKIPSSKNLSANKAAVTRNSSATRQQRKCPVNLSTDSRDLASCMTIKSLSNTLQPKKCHSVPVNSTHGSLTPPPDRSHSHSLPCIATSQWSIPATPPSSPGKSH